MPSLIQILPETAVIFVIAGAILLTGLVFRNPFRPRWLHRDSASTLAALAISAAVCFGAGYFIAGTFAAGFDIAVVLVLTPAVFLAAGYAIWRGFDIGERLRRADAGQSPFYAHPATETLRRAWPRHPAGPAGA